MGVIFKKMDYLAVFVAVIASVSSSFARSLSNFGDQDEYFADSSRDTEFSHLSPPATIFIIIASGLCLLMVLALCACGEQTKEEKAPAQTRDTKKENGGATVSPQIDDNDVKASPPNGDPNTSLTQPMTIKHAPPSPNGAASPTAESSSPQNIKRSSTIDRRLPELPPMHSKQPNISENEENDYNGTYDTIKDDKKKDAAVAGGSRKLPSTTDDDPAYNSVEDTMGGAGVTRKDGAGGGAVAGTVGGAGGMEEDGGDYASVRETSRNSSGTETVTVPSGGAEGGADESDYDGSYAKVKDVQGNSNHAYATVQDKKEREHGYARVKDVHVKPATHTNPEGAVGDAVGGAVGGADDDEEVPPVPHKPHDLESPENPSSPVSQRAGSVSSPSSPNPGRGEGGGGGGGTSPNPGGGPPGGLGGPDGDGPGPGPDNTSPGAVGTGRREPPYTQVSARESLESIRARQQHDHTQLTEEALGVAGSAGVAAPPGGVAGAGAGQDFDGIYEQVDDNSVRGQNSTSPPPLPRGRQTIPGMGRGRVYEEITEDNRPRPPGASNYDDDPEPYAVVEKTHTPKRPVEASSNSNGNHEDVKGEEKDFDQLYAKVDKTSNKQNKAEKHHVNNNNHKRTNSDMAAPDEDDFGGLYAKVDKGRKTINVMQPHRSPNNGSSNIPRNLSTGAAATPSVNNHVSAMNSYSDIYADVDDTPLSGGDVRNYMNDSLIAENNYQSIDDDLSSPSRSPVDEGMVHISEHRPNPDLWVRREHTYQAVEENGKKKKSRHRKSKEEEMERRRHHPQHSYEVVKSVEGSGATVEVSSKGEMPRKKTKPAPPTRRLSKEERVMPNLVTVKAKNANNNHMIESLPVKETRI